MIHRLVIPRSPFSRDTRDGQQHGFCVLRSQLLSDDNRMRVVVAPTLSSGGRRAREDARGCSRYRSRRGDADLRRRGRSGGRGRRRCPDRNRRRDRPVDGERGSAGCLRGRAHGDRGSTVRCSTRDRRGAGWWADRKRWHTARCFHRE